jgi:hypothetical protein
MIQNFTAFRIAGRGWALGVVSACLHPLCYRSRLSTPPVLSVALVYTPCAIGRGADAVIARDDGGRTVANVLTDTIKQFSGMCRHLDYGYMLVSIPRGVASGIPRDRNLVRDFCSYAVMM